MMPLSSSKTPETCFLGRSVASASAARVCALVNASRTVVDLRAPCPLFAFFAMNVFSLNRLVGGSLPSNSVATNSLRMAQGILRCESAWNIDPFGGVIGVGN